ncbi:hypothetical protein MIND_00811700 [Mycena indigotica]|uniref:DUF833-domain-containing protein n=1 Tax=Mycena indigotica TaxID=2126181 RepID=A0A8H6SH85_9AGAR|nr:uncharacterized protein MIND_00811700 [Mycena indigotica]KAF7298646.1 hypothetical protein MIND_00811700 [Mycena indigotica]
MCVAFWTLDDPAYALILAANRDEFLARPALPAALHTAFSPSPSASSSSSSPPIPVISGIDVQAGGTWLGLAPSTGRLALLTNITEPPPAPPPPASRGALAAHWLAAPGPDAALDVGKVYPPGGAYAGFNLLVVQARRGEAGEGAGVHVPAGAAHLVSNGGAHGRVASRALRADEHALGAMSNGIHVAGGEGGPAPAGECWPKVVAGRALFRAALADVARGDGEQGDMQLAEALFGVLRAPPGAAAAAAGGAPERGVRAAAAGRARRVVRDADGDGGAGKARRARRAGGARCVGRGRGGGAEGGEQGGAEGA